MAKKVLILSSSPRRNGNSDTLCDEFMHGVNPAKRKAKAVKNEKRFLKQKRNALKNPGYSHHPVKTQASFKRLLKGRTTNFG